MEPSLSSIVVVMLQLGVLLASGLLYLRRARVDRPPVGVFNHRDVVVIGAILVVVPVVYVQLPTLMLAAVFVVLSLAMMYFALTPLMAARRAATVAAALVALDVGLAQVVREDQPWLFNAVNDLALGIMLVGVCNMWVQSGVRARHVAALATYVAVFDVISTFRLSLMGDLVDRLATLPLSPMLTWGEGRSTVGVGLGDLLLMLLWTLVAEKAFSRRAALGAAVLALSCSLALFLAFWFDAVNRPLPAMALLGPAIAIHYRLLLRTKRRERTVAEYFATLAVQPARPGPARRTPPSLAPVRAT